MATDNQSVYEAMIQAIDRGDDEALARLLAPDIIDHNPVPGQGPGLRGIIEWLARMRKMFAGLRITLDDVVAGGDRVAGRVRWRGTHAGTVFGIAPTGKTVEFTSMHIVRVANGQIVDWWAVVDLYGLLGQLGAALPS